MRSASLIIAALAVTSLALCSFSATTLPSAQAQVITIQIGATYTCADQHQFRVVSCDARNWCQVFKINKSSTNGGFTVPYSKEVLISDIKSYQCTAGATTDSNSSSETFGSIPVTARSIDLFKPMLGNFKLVNTSTRVQLPSLLASLSVLEQSRDSAEGLYRLPGGQNIKLVALAYPSVDTSFSMADKIELEMRRQSYPITMLRRKDNKAFLVELGSGKSFVSWTNGFRAFFSFGVGTDARAFFEAGVY